MVPIQDCGSIVGLKRKNVTSTDFVKKCKNILSKEKTAPGIFPEQFDSSSALSQLHSQFAGEKSQF